jgi:hypothetical protein
VNEPLVSYRDLISCKVRWSAGEYLPRVLNHFDLPQVIAAIAPRKVSLFNPINGFRKACQPEMLHRAYALPISAYDALKTPDAFRILADTPFDAKAIWDSVR